MTSRRSGLLVPAPDTLLDCTREHEVNNVRNKGPELIEPSSRRRAGADAARQRRWAATGLPETGARATPMTVGRDPSDAGRSGAYVRHDDEPSVELATGGREARRPAYRRRGRLAVHDPATFHPRSA